METGIDSGLDSLIPSQAEPIRVPSPAQPPPLEEGSRFSAFSIKRFVVETLDSDKDFNRNRFSRGDNPNARLLDADYTEQVKIEASEIAARALEKLQSESPELTPEAQFRQACSQAFTKAAEWRESFAKFWENLSDRPVISIYGTSKDYLVNDRLKEFFKILAEKCVANGISVVSGGADTGAVGALNKAFANAREDWKVSNGGAEPPSAIAIIPLKFYGNAVESRFRDATPGFACPPLMTFLSRTPTLFSVGEQRVAIFTPGGLGTFEELSRAMAESKMANKVPGLYSEKTPLIVILDEDVGGLSAESGDQKGYFSGLRKWWKKMVDAETAKTEDFEDVAFYAVEDLSKLATLLVNQYLEPRDKAQASQLVFRSELLARAINTVHTRLEQSENFNQRRFDVSAPEALRVLDAHFKQHVVLDID